MLKIEVFIWLTVKWSDHSWILRQISQFQHTIIEKASGLDFILNGEAAHDLINWGLISEAPIRVINCLEIDLE